MNRFECPWCGPRDEIEFTWSGESHGSRPSLPEDVDDVTWTDYLHVRANPKGVIHERWCHTYGCRQWFNLVRHTVTHRVLASYPIDGVVPEIAE